MLKLDKEMYKCVRHIQGVAEYNLEHSWELKKLFGIPLFYHCDNCRRIISKKRHAELTENINIYFF